MTMQRSVRARAIAPGVVVVIFALLAAAFAPTVAGAGPTSGGATVKAIVTFKARPGLAARDTIRDLGGKVRRTYTLINGMAVNVPANALAGLRRNPLVKSVEPDATLSAMEPTVQADATGDLEYDNAWGVTHIGSKAAHDAGVRGSGIKVAVIDTGIDYIHDDPDDDPYVVDPEFTSNYRGGYDFVNNDTDPMDDNGHGTHVAGILAAEKNGYLVVGVAPEVDLYGLKILDANGQGDESNLIAALQWAVDHDIDVVNMSLGTHDVVPALQTAVENAAAAGVLLVAASGNTVTWQEIFYGCPVAYPGAYPQVLSTTFTNQNDALTGYSCTGPEVDFASPGDNIFSPVPIGPCMNCSPYGYAALSGTSMASPHLAGTAALLLDAGITDSGQPGLFDDVKSLLCATANQGWGVQTGFGGGTPIPPSDPRYANYFGCGVVDAGEAVLSINQPPANNPPVAVDDTATVAEDSGATAIAVLANDTDVDGPSLTTTSASDPPHGTTVVNGNGAVSYTPDANYHGPDSFTYVVSDGAGGSDTGAVNVTVTSVNDPPVAANDSATTTAGTAVTIPVLANDTDIDGGALAVGGVSDPPHGTAVANANGTITYTPDAGYTGPDAFGYTASDGSATSNVATVSITVNAAPPPNPFHIGDLDGSGSNSGKTWTARVTIRVDTATHGPLSGVAVTGSWSNGATGTASCTTTSSGTCVVQITKLARASIASVRFTVTGATRTGYTYTPASNHDPDNDSTGTTIVVVRPA
jgi:subtilisin